MVGFPRSGKSTIAKEMVRELGYVIVSPDAIRIALYGQRWRDESEPMVWGIAHTMVAALFEAGHDDVILDACNITPEKRIEWESPYWVCCPHIVPTTKEICIQRAVDSKMEDLIPVIERMSAFWNPPGMGRDC
jgi:predicted kinase